MLGRSGGSDTVSATIVVAAVLFGLGVGGVAAAGIADRLSRAAAVTAFATCEIGIAVCAMLSPYVFHDLILSHFTGIAGSYVVVLAIILAALLPPTLLMGLSLPLLSRVVVHDIDGAAERIGWLYGLNTLGAWLGALIAGSVTIGTVGYEVTVYLGALCNAAVGVSALLTAGALRKRPSAAAVQKRARNGATEETAGSVRRLWGWCALVFASGFLIISLEIVWFRVLGTLATSDAYAFGLILAVALVGIRGDGVGLGSVPAGRL